mmetsp:Transcript_113412/g.284048  ORF Transcript_113412/g.284048 Transcript_113412/m.284048 type:complete len:243 (-) Transcript_113412:920-1648(-)
MLASLNSTTEKDLVAARLVCSVLRSLEACHCTCPANKIGSRAPGHAAARPHNGISNVWPGKYCSVVSTWQALPASTDKECLPSICPPRSAREVMSGNKRVKAESISSACKGCQCVLVGPGHLCTDGSTGVSRPSCFVIRKPLSGVSSTSTWSVGASVAFNSSGSVVAPLDASGIGDASRDAADAADTTLHDVAGSAEQSLALMSPENVPVATSASMAPPNVSSVRALLAPALPIISPARGEG